MKIHIVQKGDTLWEIANQYEADFEKVKQLNPQLSSPDMIMPGMKIKIPAISKHVKKEGGDTSITKKEKQKPAAEKPYKDSSPPPMPVVEEDDVKKSKDVKPQMPMQPKMPSMDGLPTPPHMPGYTKAESKPPEEPKMKYYEQYPSTGAQNFHHMAPPKQQIPVKEDCGCGGPKPMPMPMPMPMNQPMMNQTPYDQPPTQYMNHNTMPMNQPMMNQMPYHQPPTQYMNHNTKPMHPFPGDCMKSTLEMPAKPMLNQCYSPETLYPGNMQHGFHYSDMPQSPHPQFTEQQMPKPPGYHTKFRMDEDDSTSE